MAPTDSKHGVFEFTGNRLREELLQIPGSQPRIESDGVVIGNTKHSVMMVRPDPCVDYKMMKATPDMKGLEGIPRRFFITPDAHPRRH